MRLISPDSGENRIFPVYCRCIYPLTQASVQQNYKKDRTTKVFQATSGLYLCCNGLLSVLASFDIFYLLEGVGGKGGKH